MVQYVTESESPIRGRGRPTKYPWDEWIEKCLDEELTVIAEFGKDFTVAIESFRQSITATAQARDLTVRTGVNPKKKTVAFRFYRKEEDNGV